MSQFYNGTKEETYLGMVSLHLSLFYTFRQDVCIQNPGAYLDTTLIMNQKTF